MEQVCLYSRGELRTEPSVANIVALLSSSLEKWIAQRPHATHHRFAPASTALYAVLSRLLRAKLASGRCELGSRGEGATGIVCGAFRCTCQQLDRRRGPRHCLEPLRDTFESPFHLFTDYLGSELPDLLRAVEHDRSFPCDHLL